MQIRWFFYFSVDFSVKMQIPGVTLFFLGLRAVQRAHQTMKAERNDCFWNFRKISGRFLWSTKLFSFQNVSLVLSRQCWTAAAWFCCCTFHWRALNGTVIDNPGPCWGQGGTKIISWLRTRSKLLGGFIFLNLPWVGVHKDIWLCPWCLLVTERQINDCTNVRNIQGSLCRGFSASELMSSRWARSNSCADR